MFSVGAKELSVHVHPRTDSDGRLELIGAVIKVSVLAQIVDSYLVNGIQDILLKGIPDGQVEINMTQELSVISLVHIWSSVRLALPNCLRTLMIGAVDIPLDYPPGSLPSTLRQFICACIAKPRKPVPFVDGLSLAVNLESFNSLHFSRKAVASIRGNPINLTYFRVDGLQSEIVLGCSAALKSFDATKVKAPILVDLSSTSALVELQIHDNRTRIVINAVPDTLQFLNLYSVACQIDLAQISESKLERLSIRNAGGRLDLSGLPEGLKELFIKDVDDLVVRDHIRPGQVRAHLKRVHDRIKNELA
jgi:hypothetical protein